MDVSVVVDAPLEQSPEHPACRIGRPPAAGVPLVVQDLPFWHSLVLCRVVAAVCRHEDDAGRAHGIAPVRLSLKRSFDSSP